MGCLSNQCPNLIVLGRAEGHDRPAYINSLSKIECQSGRKWAFVFAGLTGTFMDGRAVVLPSYLHLPSASFHYDPTGDEGFYHVLGAGPTAAHPDEKKVSVQPSADLTPATPPPSSLPHVSKVWGDDDVTAPKKKKKNER